VRSACGGWFFFHVAGEEVLHEVFKGLEGEGYERFETNGNQVGPLAGDVRTGVFDVVLNEFGNDEDDDGREAEDGEGFSAALAGLQGFEGLLELAVFFLELMVVGGDLGVFFGRGCR
jgi:hypothetical protein